MTAEFEFEEMKFVIELTEEEEVTTCEDGQVETEIENKVIDFEVEYDAEDGELEFEGSHEVEDDGAVAEVVRAFPTSVRQCLVTHLAS